MSEKMTKEERFDWLCRLRGFLVSVGMPNEWRVKFTQAVSDSIAELSAEPCNDTIKHETVTEFADRCRECGKMRKGHWIDMGSKNFDFHRVYKCSECGNTEIEYPERIRRHFRYCPICGDSKMVEPQESEVNNADSN